MANGPKVSSRGWLPKRLRKKRGPKVDPLAEENAAYRQRIDRLEAELKRAETIIEVQKSLGAAWAVRPEQPEGRRNQLNAVSDLTPQVGVAAAMLRHWQFRTAASIGAARSHASRWSPLRRQPLRQAH